MEPERKHMELTVTQTPNWETWLATLGILEAFLFLFIIIGFLTGNNKKTNRYPYILAVLILPVTIGGLYVNYLNNTADPVVAKALPGAVYRADTQTIREWTEKNYPLTYTGIGSKGYFSFSDSEEGKTCTFRVFKATPTEIQNQYKLQTQLVCNQQVVAPKK